ncbi:MAG: hypothetical protein QGF90_02835, partial [Gammaproteobacteria bacterium]|nr:hypothetical protein [Gammaproteobacteria bacterium]
MTLVIMAEVFKPMYVRPIPEGAQAFVKNGRKFVRFKDARGKLQTAQLTKDETRVLRRQQKWNGY